MCNLCIAITINLFLPMSRWCLEVVGISKHLVWCRIFGKCQNLGESDEKYRMGLLYKFSEIVSCSRWCLEVVGISICIFEKCDNLCESNEMYQLP